MTTPMDRHVTRVAEAAAAAAGDGLDFGEAAAGVLQLGFELAQRHLGTEGFVKLLRRTADEAAGPAPLNVVRMFEDTETKGSA